MYKLNMSLLGVIAECYKNGVDNPCLKEWNKTWIFYSKYDFDEIQEMESNCQEHLPYDPSYSHDDTKINRKDIIVNSADVIDDDIDFEDMSSPF